MFTSTDLEHNIMNDHSIRECIYYLYNADLQDTGGGTDSSYAYCVKTEDSLNATASFLDNLLHTFSPCLGNVIGPYSRR